MMAIVMFAACTASVELIPPTGAYDIGEVVTSWEDPTRDEALGAGPRNVTVQVWYPADPAADAEHAPYVPALEKLRPALDRREERLLSHVDVHAVLDAPPVSEPEAMPVVVLSHGDDRLGAEYSTLTEELVSHGYVVVVVDHPYDARAALDAAGEAVEYAEGAWPPLPPVPDDGVPSPDSPWAEFYRERADVRVADARFALDQLGTSGVGPLDPSRFDLTRVAFVGHSVGGVAAGTFCREEPRALACVNLDGEGPAGPVFLTESGEAFSQPYLMMTKPFTPTDEEIAGWGMTRNEWEANRDAWLDGLFGAVGGGSWRIELDGATHESFSDEPSVLAALLGDDPTVSEAHVALIRAYVLAFVDRFLGGPPSTILDEPPLAGATIRVWPADE